ncbi:amino acid permease [Frateuria aurantia]|uniref:Amino acid transporter n=1 Tax=Frateuria aurantia (strain ATCC 33424 / DSM 6220 / KCTC 2777 / LMG 1558 / NBRC 3245 / NCIMB 13370) TaxID=767434 RepID=H8L2N5_FRAAD|nr:amino acid permease [Frateuria aurantia]AFC86394.1 amino acid transporter [Frateuria aurantia DSM 6220]
MLKRLFATHAIGSSADHGAAPAGEGTTSLKRVLTARHLITLGIGAVIGAGIFVITGQAAAEHAGPALVLSFIVAGIACALSALCYAEFAAMIPVSGGAYAYAYATLGEIVAWFIGWNLVLEYLFAVASVAAGWSGYFNECLGIIGHWLHISLALPGYLSQAPLTFVNGHHLETTGAWLNLPAVLIVTALTALCYAGITQSSLVNSIIVSIKLLVIALFLIFSLRYINTANWHPFIPPSQGPGQFGVGGIFRAAVLVFFSYIGFDAVSTAAGEARNPQRDLPIGILGSLVICTVLYIAMSLTLTGIAPYLSLNTAQPVATALEAHPELLWLRAVVSFGALAGLSSVILVMLLGTSRIFFSMSQDGLLPRAMSKVHPRYRTPHVATLVGGIVAAVTAGLFPVSILGELVSMGTLLAFATVCIGVLVLRYTRPDLPRSFRVPAVWLVSTLGALICLYLFWQSFRANWPLMLGWTLAGLLIYAIYGYRHSRLQHASH